MIYRLHGAIQPYAWGGHDYIPQLLRREPSNLPAAELWFGDHPQAPAQIEADGVTLPFDTWLQRNLAHALTPASRARYGDRLPFLLKILDVRMPLSIQVHPDKAQAEAGFAREEAAGINHGAANRNYPDNNHKPESMIALGDFWLLHGFAPPEIIEARPERSLHPHHANPAQHRHHLAQATLGRARAENTLRQPRLLAARSGTPDAH